MRLRSRHITVIGLSVAIASSAVAELAVENQPTLLRRTGVTLRPGQSMQADVPVPAEEGAVLLFVRARRVREKGEGGAYVLSLSWNDTPLTPTSVAVLNKEQVWDDLTAETIRPKPLTDDAGRWYVKGDSDWVPLNDPAMPSPHPPRQPTKMIPAYASHYYEYALRIPGDVVTDRNTLRLGVSGQSDGPLEIAELRVLKAKTQVLVTAEPWMDVVFPWQAPAVTHVLTAPLEITACRGEYEPLAFGVWVLEPVDDLRFELDLGTAVPAERIQRFVIMGLERKALGEARFLADIPFTPEHKKRMSPELLVPQCERKLNAPAGHLARFMADIQVPHDLHSGWYLGEIRILGDGHVLTRVPVRLHVLPFDLVPAAAKYWMWRLTWSPAWEPANVARLHDIKAHGFNGLVRSAGVGFNIRVSDDGVVEVDGSDYARFVDLLDQAGLARQFADDHVAGKLARHVIRPLLDARIGQLEDGGQGVPAEMEAEWKRLSTCRKKIIQHIDELPDDIRATAAQRMLEGFRQVKQISDDLGATLYVFPVDEPDGTPWRRHWTTFAAGLAKQAGLETFSTRNSRDWTGHIDHKAWGLRISYIYIRPQVVDQPTHTPTSPSMPQGRYQGEIDFPVLPRIGACADGPRAHFNGEIDEVRIYDRALTSDELVRQYADPAQEGLLAHYRFDGADLTDRVADRSGHGHSLKVVGDPRQVPGVIGHAMRFDGDDDHLEPPRILPRTRDRADGHDLSRGWSISLWYRGHGPRFGDGNVLRADTPGPFNVLSFATTTGQQTQLNHFGFTDPQSWQHATYAFDPSTHTVKAYLHNPAMRDWYQRNIRWNYMQVRSQPAKNPRFKMGVMSFFYANLGNLKNITAFCYDWNANHLYVVYPKGGDRFNDEGVWYGTLGWKGTREGIDDARYLQTLYATVKARTGGCQEAMRVVRQVLGPVGDPSYRNIDRVIHHFGGYEPMRVRIVEAIVAETERTRRSPRTGGR